MLADRSPASALLMLLDNVEHLLPDAGGRRRATARCPTARRVLVTSRERLQLRRRAQSGPCRRSATTDGVDAVRSRARGRCSRRSSPTAAVAELCDAARQPAARARARRRAHGRLLARAAARAAGAAARPAQGRPRRRPAPADAAGDDRVELRAARRRTSSGSSAASPSSPAAARYEAAEAVCDADPDTLQSLLDKSLLGGATPTAVRATGCSRRSASTQPSGSPTTPDQVAPVDASRRPTSCRAGQVERGSVGYVVEAGAVERICARTGQLPRCDRLHAGSVTESELRLSSYLLDCGSAECTARWMHCSVDRSSRVKRRSARARLVLARRDQLSRARSSTHLVAEAS